MDALAYYSHISECVDTFASKGDLILNGGIDPDDFESFLSLACLYTSYYHKPFPVEVEDMVTKQTSTKRNKRKSTGQFFTPPYIAEYIVSSTIGPLIEKIRNDKRIKNKTKKILNLKVCDPCMGAGIFLVKAHDFIFEHLLALEINPTEEDFKRLSRDSAKCVFGVDIDPKAVKLAKISIELNHMKHGLVWKIEDYVNSVASNFS